MSDTTTASGPSSGASTPSTASSTDLAALNTLGLELGGTPQPAASLATPADPGATPAASPAASGYITPERVSKPLGSTGALWGNVAWERAFASPPRR
jgi:hypothetical protein